MTHDLRTSYFNLLNLELCEECSRTSGPESSRAAGECNHGAAIEADTIGEQKLKQTQSGAAAEADAIGEQQLKQMQKGSYSRRRMGGK